MKKHVITTIMLLLICISLSACGNRSEPKKSETQTKEESAKIEAPAEPARTKPTKEEIAKAIDEDDYDYTEYYKNNFPADRGIVEAIAGEEFDKLSPQTQILVVRMGWLDTTLYALKLTSYPGSSESAFVISFLRENPEYVMRIAKELDPLIAPKGSMFIPNEDELNRLKEIVDEILAQREE